MSESSILYCAYDECKNISQSDINNWYNTVKFFCNKLDFNLLFCKKSNMTTFKGLSIDHYSTGVIILHYTGSFSSCVIVRFLWKNASRTVTDRSNHLYTTSTSVRWEHKSQNDESETVILDPEVESSFFSHNPFENKLALYYGHHL
jgi:hypothetical protein